MSYFFIIKHSRRIQSLTVAQFVDDMNNFCFTFVIHSEAKHALSNGKHINLQTSSSSSQSWTEIFE